MLNWFLDFRISGRRPRAGRPIGRAAGGGSNGGDGTVQEEERAAKSGPMLRGPERFSRSSALAVPIPGTKAAPIYIAFWRSSYASGSSRARPSSARSSEPRRARRKEGRERTLCRETMLRTPPPRRRRHESFFFLLLNSQRVVRKASRAGVGDLKTEADAVDAIFLR